MTRCWRDCALKSPPKKRLKADRRRTFTLSMQTLNTLLAQGTKTELSYMSADGQAAALALEAELLADAHAGVDLRIRLIGAAVSQ